MASGISSVIRTIVSLPLFSRLIDGTFRYFMPIISIVLLFLCAKSMLTFHRKPEVWAWLKVGEHTMIPVTHWENTIGRSKRADISVRLQSLRKTHAVLTRYDDDSWTISDVGSKGGVYVQQQVNTPMGLSIRKEPVDIREIDYGDIFTLANTDFELIPLNENERLRLVKQRRESGTKGSSFTPLLVLLLFQLVSLLRLCSDLGDKFSDEMALGFLLLACAELFLYFVTRLLRQQSFDVEVIAFYLCALGLLVVCSAAKDSIVKECMALFAGIVLYFIACLSLRNLELAKKVRYLAAAVGLLLLGGNVILGTVINGARNWVYIGGFSFQPSELVKLCFVFVGASTLDRIVSKRILFLFIVYSGLICLCLAFISDFGAALIFFAAFLVIAYLRSGDFTGTALMAAAAGYAVTIVIKFRPYILNRFSAWGHVWEYANESGGYQQTRAMICIVSGGLFGLGGSAGFLKYVAASDTDLVFALLSEDYGLIIGITAITAVVILAAFTIRSLRVARSTFYVIAASASITIILLQTILNVFGTVDILPLTGVTFPFVSNGGSSMLCAWGLLAFIKAADTRQNSSIAIRQIHGVNGAAEDRLDDDDETDCPVDSYEDDVEDWDY